MCKKKWKVMLLLVILMIGGVLIWSNEGKKNKKVIRVGGWDMEYIVSDRELKLEDFENIEFGSSLREIEDKFGEPDGWTGSGIVRPVYVLKDGSAVELFFGNSAGCEDLEAVYHYKGEEEFVLKKK